MLKYLLGGVAALAIFATPAKAELLGGLNFDATNAVILGVPTLTAPGQQVTNLPCLICGANQPQQPDGFGYNWFGNTGNANTVSFFSTAVTPVNRGDLGLDTIGTGYSLLPGSTFDIGIDMNQSNTAQTLESFWFLNLTQQTVLAVFSPGPGGVELPVDQNGTGFPDYTLSGLSLAGINQGDTVMFFARITGANDGPDSFFLIPRIQEVPLPAAVWLFGAGLAGLGLLSRRKRKQQQLSVA
jgi:hypothetical protein